MGHACVDDVGCDGIDCGAGASCEDIVAPGTGYTCACVGSFGTTSTNAAAVCTGCTVVLDSIGLPSCTDATDSQVSACSPGFSLCNSGGSTCSDGTTNVGTADICSAANGCAVASVVASTNGVLGSKCDGGSVHISSSESCDLVCNSGYTLAGVQAYCDDGALSASSVVCAETEQMDVMALSAVLVRHVLTLLRLVQATAALARLA